MTQADKTASSRVDPYRNFQFRVWWEGRYVAAVSKVSALSRAPGPAPRGKGGAYSTVRRLPRHAACEPVTLERGLGCDDDFVRWAEMVSQLVEEKGAAALPAELRRDVIIDVVDEAGTRVLSCALQHAWVSEFTVEPEVDADASAVVIQTIKLEHGGMERHADLLAHRLGGLARRVEAEAAWQDIVLLPESERLLREIEAAVRTDPVFRDSWGFGRRPGHGAGLTAVFAGRGGTGKTLAARVLASELGLDLFVVDPAAVVHK